MNVTDDMVNRFLNWRLPEGFAPDAGITFKPLYNEHMPWGGNKHEPTGTNLLDATQARQMLEHVLAIEPKPTNAMSDTVPQAITDEESNLEYLQTRPAQELALWQEWVLVVCRRKEIAVPTGREWDALIVKWHHNKMPVTSVDELERLRSTTP